MKYTKKLVIVMMTILFTVSLFGCSTTTTYDRGNGTVVAVRKIKDRDYQPHEATKTGAQVGGTIGAVGGAAAGGFVGLAAAALSLAPTPALIAATLGGAVIGAAIVGGAGAAAGGGLGYVVDVGTPNAGLYQYIVKPENSASTLTVTQYSRPIPTHTSVHILEKNDSLFIKERK